uniref:K Homology domain-containing protein n=1 Tax=Setaria digitata TaxID=48799 RepID=A0A915PC50_9BILA
MKRHGGDDDLSPSDNHESAKSGKRQRPDSYQEALAAGKYELRLLVSSRGAGGIIGKGQFSMIESMNAAGAIEFLRCYVLYLHYHENVHFTECAVGRSVFLFLETVRIATIVATVENVLAIVTEVIPKLDDSREGDSSRPIELRVLVHSSHAGAVIGRQGSKIKEMKEELGVQMKVFAQCPPQSTERVVSIKGAPDKIIACVNHIMNMLKEIPIKGVTKPYESMFYDPSYSAEYGGYPPDRNYRGPMIRGPMAMASYGNYGRNFPRQIGGRGPLSAVALPPYMGPEESTQVTIPNELGGTIIGKGGERINRVREESGAQIVVGPQQESGERIITITGTSTAIQTAQYLLQQCVRQSVAGRRYLNEM